MQRACTLLETTSEKIAAVASQVGYDNPFYFSRLFRRTFGVTPTSFRIRKTKRSD
jgi:AraC-like DNA-binding protein